jgi:UDP-N-acetylmuramate dehydrogenase
MNHEMNPTPTDTLIQQNIPLAPMTTLGIGGPARFFAEVRAEDELGGALAFAIRERLPVFVMGGGSNLLVADEGFPGLVIRVAIRGIEWRADSVTAAAGEDWDAFVGECVARDLAGVECLSGIPGLVGGTPVQNVGAYGQEVSETIVSVRAYDRQANRIVTLGNAGCGFSYRTSIFNTTARDRYVVLAVSYALRPHGAPALRYPDVKTFFADRAAAPTLREVRDAVRTIRARKGMVIAADDPDSHSAGSFFKNPILTREQLARLEAEAPDRVPNYPAIGDHFKVPAAWLIEQAGFQRGYARGRAGISSKHTLAIVNRGGATAREVLELVEEIQDRVRQRFAIELTPEPVFVGFQTEEWGVKSWEPSA